MATKKQDKNVYTKKMYTKRDINVARQLMLGHLASLSGGVVIPGCCTQDCCDKDAQIFAMRLSQ